MNASARCRWATIFLGAILSAAPARSVQPDAAPRVDPAVLLRIRDAAMASDWTYRQLAEMTDKIGPRPSGSPAAEAAVAQLAQAMRRAGAEVTLQPAKVTHWVRGEETASLIDYAGRPEGVTQSLHLTALGSSSATSAQGLVAPLLVVRDFKELHARAAEVKGRIVVFENRFDQLLADNGHADTAYEQAGEYRFDGPSRAAELGAAAALVRSVGGADYRLPHTGTTFWTEGQAPIPCAALSAEDADLINRLAAQGPVRMRLTLTPRTLPDVESHNLLADLSGREKPDEVVIVSGHLDSWDLGTGAIDDGGPMMAAMGAVELLKRLGLTPRRTLRAIGWMDEENGQQRGAKAYFESVKGRLATQVAAIESDAGTGRPLGIVAAVSPESLKTLEPLIEVLRPIGASRLERREPDDEVGSDIGPLQAAGVPGFAPLVDTRHYFDYHHTAADTLDKVDPDALRRQVAVMAVLAWYLAEMPEPLPRAPAQEATNGEQVP
ncbi:MAG: M20/M25/M40 family metallo-hydrolase [Panacagrimonas sp.]